MMFDSLPVIIVTAKTKTAAAEMITDMIDDDVTAETRPPSHESSDRVWRLINKYYTALVRVRPRAEDDVMPTGADAHVTVLDRDELDTETCSRRLPASPAAVNVLACITDTVPDDLLTVCARRHLEPAALCETNYSTECGPFSEPRGMEVVRAALHAHTWSSLRPIQHHREMEDEMEMQEEMFSRTLSALSEAATHTALLEGPERRAAAERLVLAFAAAIGQPLHDLDLDPDPELELELDREL